MMCRPCPRIIFTDEKILQENARSVKISSPDFVGMDPEDAAKLYLKRIDMKIPHFETMTETDLNYVKMINAGERIEYNNVSFGYLSHRIVFYLMNLHIKTRQTFFARAGTSSLDDSYKADASLSDEVENTPRRCQMHYSNTHTMISQSYGTIILELEREKNDLLIIAHESVLRVLYGYLWLVSYEYSYTKFPRNEIIEIIPASYQNEAKRIHIEGLAPEIIPGSPEDIRIPVLLLVFKVHSRALARLR
ncbi:hypothetical protein DID88_010247 [Monilinia fructigena]|uniref:6-phosphofructo-2-kinase domain-containing protein n=1 Tax=Monilinia fructigena TaxID=38457 RepID=A0A395IKM8_9HELO|nr:hypothetical protein DID88_010247 [Monilinia fructigena]